MEQDVSNLAQKKKFETIHEEDDQLVVNEDEDQEQYTLLDQEVEEMACSESPYSDTAAVMQYNQTQEGEGAGQMPHRVGDEENIELENYHNGENQSSESENESSGEDVEQCIPLIEDFMVTE